MTVQEIQTMIRQNMVLYRNVAKPLTDKEADLLIATWADALSDVPSAAGKLAFRRALRVCHFPVLIADLYDQLRAMQMESEPKAADLWQLVCERAHKANENKGLYSFTGHLPDGRTQGQAARDANKRLFLPCKSISAAYKPSSTWTRRQHRESLSAVAILRNSTPVGRNSSPLTRKSSLARQLAQR